MHRTFRRAAAASLLLLVLPSTAWASLDTHQAVAQTNAVRVSLFENVVGAPAAELGRTDAAGSSTPTSSAGVTAATVAGQAVGDVVTAESDGDRVADPAEGDGCNVPVTAPGLTLDALCASAEATAGPADDVTQQLARAELLLAGVGVDGSLLAAALTEPLDVLLEDLLDDLGDAALADGLAQLTTACDELLPLDDEDDPTDEVPNTVGDLLGMTPADLESAEEVLDTLEDLSCSALLDLSAHDLTQDVVDVAPIADALDGVEILSLTLTGASSEVAGRDADVRAEAEQVLLAVDGPSLDFLDEVIVAVVQGALDGVLTEIEEAAGQEFPEELDVTDELADGLDTIPLLDDSAPLLSGVVSGGSAHASISRTSATTSGGGDLPYVTLSIAPGVAELLAGDPEASTITLEAGQTQTIAEGTPVESTVSVGDNVVDDEAEFGDTGLRGTESRTSVTTVSLLSGVEGGIEIALGESVAAVFGEGVTTSGTPDPAPEPEDPPLPRTGGGAAIAAVLALGAAALLWRRRSND